MRQKKSLTTSFVFHVALNEQVQVGINLRHLGCHLLTTLDPHLRGKVIRPAKIILIRVTGDGKIVLMWNEHK